MDTLEYAASNDESPVPYASQAYRASGKIFGLQLAP